jgi:hypothetical protein
MACRGERCKERRVSGGCGVRGEGGRQSDERAGFPGAPYQLDKREKKRENEEREREREGERERERERVPGLTWAKLSMVTTLA